MNTKYQFIVLAVIFISLSSLSPSDGAKPNGNSKKGKLVNDFCNRKGTGMKKVLCLEILNSDPRTSNASNYYPLFNVTMDKAIANLTKTRSYFHKFGNLKPQLKKTLDFCISRFDIVMKIYKQALSQVVGGKTDLDMVSYDVEMSNDYAWQCREKMDGDGVHDSTLEKMSYLVVDYTVVCQALTDAMAEKTSS